MHRNGRNLFFIAQLISILGSELSRFAIPLWIYQLTGSNTLLSWSAFLGIFPKVVMGPYAGSVVDARSPIKILIFSDLAQFVATLLLVLLTKNFSDRNASFLILFFFGLSPTRLGIEFPISYHFKNSSASCC